ncbi:hypothetical protein [Porphyromonas endodontalis]|uniref:hypothetical protein n=1 Tax=Porphyromonas endodontalis TaxID=28124 RepID=UPI003C72FAED
MSQTNETPNSERIFTDSIGYYCPQIPQGTQEKDVTSMRPYNKNPQNKPCKKYRGTYGVDNCIEPR